MTLRARVALVKRVPPARASPTATHVDHPAGDDARAACPWGTPTACRAPLSRHGRMQVLHRRRAAARRRPGLHGPGRGRLRRRPRSRAGDEVVLFGPATRRADRAGLGRRARHHPLRDRHRRARQPRSRARTPGPPREANPAGACSRARSGRAATGVAVGVAAKQRAKIAAERRGSPPQLVPRAGEAPRGEPCSVMADDGVRLSCEEIEADGKAAADGGARARLRPRPAHLALPAALRSPSSPTPVCAGALRPAQPRPVRRAAPARAAPSSSSATTSTP